MRMVWPVIAVVLSVGCGMIQTTEERAAYTKVMRERRVHMEQQYKEAADACIALGGVPMYCFMCDYAQMNRCEFSK